MDFLDKLKHKPTTNEKKKVFKVVIQPKKAQPQPQVEEDSQTQPRPRPMPPNKKKRYVIEDSDDDDDVPIHFADDNDVAVNAAPQKQAPTIQIVNQPNIDRDMILKKIQMHQQTKYNLAADAKRPNPNQSFFLEEKEKKETKAQDQDQDQPIRQTVPLPDNDSDSDEIIIPVKKRAPPKKPRGQKKQAPPVPFDDPSPEKPNQSDDDIPQLDNPLLNLVKPKKHKGQNEPLDNPLVGPMGQDAPLPLLKPVGPRGQRGQDVPLFIKAPTTYYLNNRELFISSINGMFDKYRVELDDDENNISCDTIGKDNTSFSLLTHQKIVREYLNLLSPYRSLLLYHGLGSGKTCTSIAIAEGMKQQKKIIILTPASLQQNYRNELKKCGDQLYKKNQYWRWVPIEQQDEALLARLASTLDMQPSQIKKQKGAFMTDPNQPPNYEQLDNAQKKKLDKQLELMIERKYEFINYNGLTKLALSRKTESFTKNIFDDKVIIIDESHNLVSRIINKLKTNSLTQEETGNQYTSIVLYRMLMNARNAKIVMLSGTPIINQANEFAVTFNILRGYIKRFVFKLNTANVQQALNTETMTRLLNMGNNTVDYVDYNIHQKTLSITRNPYGFENVYDGANKYKGVSYSTNAAMSDGKFMMLIKQTLNKHKITIEHEEEINQKLLPDTQAAFAQYYIDPDTKQLKNIDALQRRIIGLSSYFNSAQESLLPRYNKELNVDFFIDHIPMSDAQFVLYEERRVIERKTEKFKSGDGREDEPSSTYRIFSRLLCNFAMPDRPYMEKPKELEADADADNGDDMDADAIAAAADADINVRGPADYQARIQAALLHLQQHGDDFFTPDNLAIYSPKFAVMLQRISDENNVGNHLVYSQFRTMEGIGIFSMVLIHNGYSQFKIKKQGTEWVIDMTQEELDRPSFGLFTGTETTEEKDIIRNIYNGDLHLVPSTLRERIKRLYPNDDMYSNKYGEVMKLFMITSSGSEGINLRNTRFVHLMEPYWNPVRTDQVIGRARRICSHKTLPPELQTVTVFNYIMVFSEKQLSSDRALELKNNDISKKTRLPITTDQYLFEVSDNKLQLINQMKDVIKNSSIDCYLYSNGKCVNFGNTTANKFAYYPDYAVQPSDFAAKMNIEKVELIGQEVTIKGRKYYAVKTSNPDIIDLYDVKTFTTAPLKLNSFNIKKKVMLPRA